MRKSFSKNEKDDRDGLLIELVDALVERRPSLSSLRDYFARPVYPSAIVGMAMTRFLALCVPHVP